LTIIADTREHADQWERIRQGFDAAGVQYVRSKLLVGDYQALENPLLVIDRKHNLAEVAGNFTDERKIEGKRRNRLEDEMTRAKELGIKIVFLIEHGGKIRSLEDVMDWQNPRLKTSPLAISGVRIYRKMVAYANFYGVEWAFCDKRHTAKRIVEILEEGQHGKG